MKKARTPKAETQVENGARKTVGSEDSELFVKKPKAVRAAAQEMVPIEKPSESRTEESEDSELFMKKPPRKVEPPSDG